jgi:hypothetical protein
MSNSLLASALAEESGPQHPADLVVRFRAGLGHGVVGKLMDDRLFERVSDRPTRVRFLQTLNQVTASIDMFIGTVVACFAGAIDCHAA